MRTYVWYQREPSEEGRVATEACASLFNKAGGAEYTYHVESANPDNPGFGVPVGGGSDGLSEGNNGAQQVERIRAAILGTSSDAALVAQVQGRLDATELAVLQTFLSAAIELDDAWCAGGAP